MSMVVIGLLSGLAFGYVITRVGATDPDRMARAHLMIDPAIPRFMLMAVVLSALGLSGLLVAGSAETSVLPTSILATSLAAVIFGVGWGLAGYCPGTTWAAAGEGRLDAIGALLGGLCGAAFFAQLHEWLIPALYAPSNVGKLTLADAFGGSRLIALIVLVAGLAAGVWIIGWLWSGEDEGR